MIDIPRNFSGDIALGLLAASDDPLPFSNTETIRLAWRHGLRPTGVPARWEALELSLLDIVRLAGLGAEMSPDDFGRMIGQSPRSDAADTEMIAAAATVALRNPTMTRWISANTNTVAASSHWHQVIQGLGGLTVSVPIAEEALFNLMKAKAKLPKQLAENVQMNVWFSRRFAARFRRRMGAKRVRLRERGATARAWSHARTSLGSQVPFEWSSRHGRGGGRQLDAWSTELLVAYVDVFDSTYVEGPPAVIASLYAIAAGAIGHRPEDPAVAAKWDSLPLSVENRAREMLGLERAAVPEPELAALRTLTEAARARTTVAHGRTVD